MTSDERPADPIIDAYKRDVDRASLRQNLRRSPEERVRNLQALQQLAIELGRAGRSTRYAASQPRDFETIAELGGRGGMNEIRICIDVPDVERAIAFYTEALGLRSAGASTRSGWSS